MGTASILSRSIRIMVECEPNERKIGAWWDVVAVIDEELCEDLIAEINDLHFDAGDVEAPSHMMDCILRALTECGTFSPLMFYDVRLRIIGCAAQIGQASRFFRGAPKLGDTAESSQ